LEYGIERMKKGWRWGLICVRLAHAEKGLTKTRGASRNTESGAKIEAGQGVVAARKERGERTILGGKRDDPNT